LLGSIFKNDDDRRFFFYSQLHSNQQVSRLLNLSLG
jgi:hypothetical protein